MKSEPQELDQQYGAGERARGTGRPLRAHPLFTPVLAIWGALFGGLVTLVLPAGLVLAAAAQIGLGALDELSRYLVAALAAGVGAAIMLLVGRALAAAPRQQADTPSLAVLAVQHVRTIDPVNELGSSSLDAPVEATAFAAAAPQDETAAEAAAAPLETDLAGFAAMPGRNGVWVEEAPVAEAPDAAETAAAFAIEVPAEALAETPIETGLETAPAIRPLSPSAIERLRAVPTSELSLIQMVERFAAAVHEHQSATRSRADLAGREAALAEALKALAALSGESEGETQSEPLRAALSRLQELRGAA
jgi:hypothetical protein